MGILKEFKEFAVKGNVVDMAVGVIIGGAFGKIVTSLVNDVLMPPIGVLLGDKAFQDLKWDISSVKEGVSALTDKAANLAGLGGDVVASAAKEAEPVYLCYGAFIQQCIDFLIIAFCVFIMVKILNKVIMKREKQAAQTPPAPPAPSKEEVLLTEIRDLLKAQKK